jgi:hypothetical protein
MTHRQGFKELSEPEPPISSREGPESFLVPLDEAAQTVVSEAKDLAALDRALEELARLNPRRFFGGLDVAETAALLNISEATLLRDRRAARALAVLRTAAVAPQR